MPSPNSALSSNSELAHAGPAPLRVRDHGVVGRLPPKIDEQPVALAMIKRSPKSCVRSLKYGVSPHPAQAPDASNSGSRSCEPLMVSASTCRRGVSGSRRNVRAERARARDGAPWTPCRWRVGRDSILLLAGQTSTHTAHPVQSSGKTWIVFASRSPSVALARLPRSHRNSAGAPASAAGRKHLHPDRGMRADQRAHAALDAQLASQIGISDAIAASRSARCRWGTCRRPAARYRQEVTLAGQHQRGHALHEFGSIGERGGMGSKRAAAATPARAAPRPRAGIATSASESSARRPPRRCARPLGARSP